jgi:hypothetical protein
LAAPLPESPSHCAGGARQVSNVAGIPGSHSALAGGECVAKNGSSYQGLIMISKSR